MRPAFSPLPKHEVGMFPRFTFKTGAARHYCWPKLDEWASISSYNYKPQKQHLAAIASAGT
jgi:hypothetical protein